MDWWVAQVDVNRMRNLLVPLAAMVEGLGVVGLPPLATVPNCHLKMVRIVRSLVEPGLVNVVPREVAVLALLVLAEWVAVPRLQFVANPVILMRRPQDHQGMSALFVEVV